MERMITEAHWGYYSFAPKTGEVCERGKIAAFDTTDGSVINAKTATTLIPIGIWHESKTADGVIKVQVKLWKEIQLSWWVNDTVAPIAITDRGKICAVKDNQTVSIDATGRSKAGMIFDVQAAKGVLVYFNYDTAP